MESCQQRGEFGWREHHHEEGMAAEVVRAARKEVIAARIHLYHRVIGAVSSHWHNTLGSMEQLGMVNLRWLSSRLLLPLPFCSIALFRYLVPQKSALQS
jgi:hypothetical protein